MRQGVFAMTELKDKTYTGERALFFANGLRLEGCVFEDGESPLKHSKDISLTDTEFRWKYPLWYSEGISMTGCRFTETARAAIWYTKNITAADTDFSAQKGFRRCKDVELSNVKFPNALETLWQCRDISMKNVKAEGDYFGMNCVNAEIDNFTLNGNYAFDGAENITIRNSWLNTKDAFWNSRNITAVNCYISGEYLAWNSENVTLIGCTIESLQGLCFVKNLVIRNCRFVDTTLAFEYSTVDAEISGHIDSVKNPLGGTIKAGDIGVLIMEPDRVDINATKIEPNC